MCLAVPGKIIAIHQVSQDDPGGATGTVDFQGSRIDVSLIMTPEAQAGDWVLVHAGFALNTLDEKDAQETWDYLRQMDAELARADAQAVENNKD